MPVRIGRAAFNAADTVYKALFVKAHEGTPTISDPFWDVTDVEAGNVELHFSGGLPGMREWKGERIVRRVAQFMQNVQIREYELTMGVKATDLEDDRLGLYKADALGLGEQTRTHKDVLFAELMRDGFTTGLCYDGKPFFATDHPLQSGTNSNKGTAALSAEAFVAGIKALRKQKTWAGEPYDCIPRGRLKLVVPPDLENTAMEIVSMDRLASGAANPNYKRADIVVNARATSTTAWMLLVGDGMAVRPLVWLGRRKPRLVAKNQPTEDNMFWDNEAVWGVDGRYRAVYGEYRAAYGSTGA